MKNSNGSWQAEAVTPAQCKEHFLKIGGKPNDPKLDVALDLEQMDVQWDLAIAPEYAEFSATMKTMKVSAPSSDEVPIDMIRNAPERTQMRILELLQNMWIEADLPDEEATHWDLSVHKALVLMLWKKKGSIKDFAQMSGISRQQVCCELYTIRGVIHVGLYVV